jgi:hypothetical protein
MSKTVFFSWQSDRPTREGRNLIERALEAAVSRMADDAAVEEAVREGLTLDKDMKGVPGSPPLFDTILKKIEGATVFVPDLTFVGTRSNGEPTPNLNVLIEYGWALRHLGHHRIVAVMNEAHGGPNPLEVIEQITYLLFLKRLDEQEIAEELKANREKKPMQKRFFPEGKDSKKRSFQDSSAGIASRRPIRAICTRWSASTSSPGSALWAAMARPTLNTWRARVVCARDDWLGSRTRQTCLRWFSCR